MDQRPSNADIAHTNVFWPSCDSTLHDNTMALQPTNKSLILTPTQINPSKNHFINTSFSSKIQIGRDKTCDIKFDANIQHISRKHCVAFYNSCTDLLFLQDTSTNGTYINFQKVKQINLLKNGDTLCFGKIIDNKKYEYKVAITPTFKTTKKSLFYQSILCQGWIRNEEILHCLEIPSPIQVLILIFYKIDLWFANIGKFINSSKDHHTIMMGPSQHCNSAITTIGFISHPQMNLTKHFSWTIKVSKFHGKGEINFGIVRKSNQTLNLNSIQILSDPRLCVLRLTAKQQIESGDIFTMQLNISSQQIRYFKNHQIHSDWIQIKLQTKPIQIYYMIVSISGAPWSQVTLLDYREY